MSQLPLNPLALSRLRRKRESLGSVLSHRPFRVFRGRSSAPMGHTHLVDTQGSCPTTHGISMPVIRYRSGKIKSWHPNSYSRDYFKRYLKRTRRLDETQAEILAELAYQDDQWMRENSEAPDSLSSIPEDVQ